MFDWVLNMSMVCIYLKSGNACLYQETYVKSEHTD